jgi:hypothetical protein
MLSDNARLGLGNSLTRFFYTLDEIDKIEDYPGLYSVLCYCDGEYCMIDIGQSDDLKSAVGNNAREEFWHQNCAGNLLVSVFYTFDMKEPEIRQLELEIREQNGLLEVRE